jgi:flagellar biosynthetic protein FliR
MDGHHQLIICLVKSFEVVPLSLQGITMLSQNTIGTLGKDVIWQGLKIASPVVISIFFMNLIMGVMGRAVPQVNVLITSLPVNAMVSFLVILISIPLMLHQMDALSALTMQRLFMVLKGL